MSRSPKQQEEQGQRNGTSFILKSPENQALVYRNHFKVEAMGIIRNPMHFEFAQNLSKKTDPENYINASISGIS
jgi:hypothetical protein